MLIHWLLFTSTARYHSITVSSVALFVRLHRLSALLSIIVSRCYVLYEDTQYHSDVVSIITPRACSYRISYYHTDTLIQEATPYACITVTNLIPALCSLFLSHQQFLSDHRLLHLNHSIKVHTSATLPSFLTLTLQTKKGPLPLPQSNIAHTLSTFSSSLTLTARM